MSWIKIKPSSCPQKPNFLDFDDLINEKTMVVLVKTLFHCDSVWSWLMWFCTMMSFHVVFFTFNDMLNMVIFF